MWLNLLTDNPSSMWSRYKGCQRLIHVDNYSGGTSYLLGCESVKCCKRNQSGNQVEFQIPNVQYSDPTREVEITYTGNVTITNFDEKMVADEWAWSVQTHSGSVIGDYKAYTVDCSGQGAAPQEYNFYSGRLVPLEVPGSPFNSRIIRALTSRSLLHLKRLSRILEECQGNILSCSNDTQKLKAGVDCLDYQLHVKDGCIFTRYKIMQFPGYRLE